MVKQTNQRISIDVDVFKAWLHKLDHAMNNPYLDGQLVMLFDDDHAGVYFDTGNEMEEVLPARLD